MRLEGILVAIQPGGEWLAAHQDTVMLVEEERRLPRPGMDPFRTRPRFVMGVTIDGESRAYYVEHLAKQAIHNDELAGEPLLVFARRSALFATIYSRSVSGATLTFLWNDDTFLDSGTGSTWDAATGDATGGPLAGTALRQVAASSAFDWAWLLHNPEPTFYPPRG